MSEATHPIQVGLLTGPTMSKWAAAAVERMLADTPAEITLVIQETPSEGRSAFDAVRRVVELREWGLVAAALELCVDDLDPVERVPVNSLDGIEEAEWLTCDSILVDGWKTRLPARAVHRLADVDIAFRFGFGFLVGDALTAPDQGILSFHHGNFREYRGKPMGFWEYVHGRETGTVTLQRITETLDSGEIVAEREVDIGDAPTWGAVKCRLFAASEGMLAEGLRTLEADDVEPETLSEDDLGDLYTLPRGRPVLTYLLKTARGIVRESTVITQYGTLVI